MNNMGLLRVYGMVLGVAGLALTTGTSVARGQCTASASAKLVASNGAAYDEFGANNAVAISDDLVVVGVYGHDNLNGTNAGAAIVYRRYGTQWLEEATLLASDGAAGDQFGISVAISSDTIVVGADRDGPGSAYVFCNDGSTWVQCAKLTASDGMENDHFGDAVSISGTVAVISAPWHNDNRGSAYVFVSPPSGWTDMPETAKLTAFDGAPNDFFATDVNIDGDTVLVGAFGDDGHAGSGYVFVRPPGGWASMTETVKLIASDGALNDEFGVSVSISNDIALIGARHDDLKGSVYIFAKPVAGWDSVPSPLQGNVKLAASDGAADDQFGRAVSINGDQAIIGAQWHEDCGVESGSAYVFRFDGISWTERAKLLAFDCAPGDWFGTGVGLSGGTAIVGAFRDDNEIGTNAGAAYLFHGLADCNGNDELDICDIATGSSSDLDSNGVPDECEPILVSMDIRPGSCPNPLNRNSHGVLPVALIGTADFDPTLIDLTTVLIGRADGIGGQLAPHEGPPGPHSTIEDVATPFGGDVCDCHDQEGDGIDDLRLVFKTDDLVAALELGDLLPGDSVELVVSGEVMDGTPFEARDCVVLVPRGSPPGLLSVNAGPATNWIEVDFPDTQFDGGGFGSFSRTYELDEIVTLTAPATSQGTPFRAWIVNGVVQPVGQRVLDIDIQGDVTTVKAAYDYLSIGPRLERMTASDQVLGGQ